MKDQHPAFSSYQTGARSARAKTIGSLALGAGALALAANTADAAPVVFYPTSNNSSSIPSTPGTAPVLYFNFLTGVFSNTGGSHTNALWQRNTTGPGDPDGVYNYFSQIVRAAGSDKMAKFTSGAVISGSLNFGPWGYPNRRGEVVDPTWAGTTGFIALRSGAGNFGWAQIQTNADTSTITILALGGETQVGVPVTIPTIAVPEPATSAALLALGAAGLVAYRQRKKIQRAA